MGGGAMLRTVAAAARGPPAAAANNHLLSFPSTSASNSRSFRPHCINCLSYGGICRCQCVDGRQGERINGSFINRVLERNPSRIEVENAIAALQSFVNGVLSRSEADQRTLQIERYSRVYEAFRLLQTDPSVQRMVMSLSSDRAVWDAILNNEMVKKLQEPLCTAGEESSQGSSEEPDLSTQILRWILEMAKAKVMELIERFQSLVNEVFHPSVREKSTKDQLEEKIVSSMFLSIVILMIVIVARVQRG